MSVEGDPDFLNRLVDNLVDEKMLNRLGLSAIHRIKQRTREGKDKDDVPFVAAPTAKPGKGPYSPGHRRKRVKNDVQVEFVNLHFSHYETMMDYVDHVVHKDFSGVEIFISNEDKEELLGFHIKGAGKSKVVRDPWGLTEKDEKEIRDIIDVDVQKLFRSI